MTLAKGKQNILDWITQQWVILSGRQIDISQASWILGPFGSQHGIGVEFIQKLAEKENLIIESNQSHNGLIDAIQDLGLTKYARAQLNPKVIDFYENTALYNFELEIKWNPFFKIFGLILKVFFSNRINQLNIPISSNTSSELTSDIIKLVHPSTAEVVRTIWLRTFKETQQVVYSGVYEICEIPDGIKCIKAIFPLPHGNATVILTPSIGSHGELILTSAGKKFGDSGFYFLLKDSKGKLWSTFIRSFQDELIVSVKNGQLYAVQKLTLWGFRVLTFTYKMFRK